MTVMSLWHGEVSPYCTKMTLTTATRDAAIAEVSAQTGVSAKDIVSLSRIPAIAQARQLCMWKLRRTGLYGYQQIGRAFGRDHTTAMHAVRVVEARMCGESAE